MPPDRDETTAASLDDSMIGSVLLGRYRVVRELAKGGMGVVYLARAEGAVGFVKPVVIKLLLPEHAQDDRFVGMFVREAQILSQLRHPSLVDVIEFGEEDDAYVLILEYVRGYHLGQWLRFLSLKKREAPADILIQIVIDALEALHHAHKLQHPDGTSMQIVHRDVSPSNILLDQDGRGRLLDFGVARMRGGANDYKTQVKGFMGKLPYTAPELFANQEASPRSDLYACAVVLHEALYGSNGVPDRDAGCASTQCHEPHPGPRGARPAPAWPAGSMPCYARALVKAPAERVSDARGFCDCAASASVRAGERYPVGTSPRCSKKTLAPNGAAAQPRVARASRRSVAPAQPGPADADAQGERPGAEGPRLLCFNPLPVAPLRSARRSHRHGTSSRCQSRRRPARHVLRTTPSRRGAARSAKNHPSSEARRA